VEKRTARKKRHLRIRNKIVGTPDRPRMCVSRSARNLYIQIIDDYSGQTIVSASTEEPAVSEQIENGGNKEAAKLTGELVAARALEQGIEEVVFDRSGYKFHGRIKEAADAAREKGLNL